MRKRIALIGATSLISSTLAWAGMYSDHADEALEGQCIGPLVKIQQERRKSSLTPVVELFQGADLNKDNAVCREEVAYKTPEKLAIFAPYDINNDGCITPTEVKQRVRRQMEAFWASDHSIMDLNNDGAITIDELQRRYSDVSGNNMTPQEIIFEYDGDFDGRVTAAEYIARSWELMRLMEPPPDKDNTNQRADGKPAK